MIALADEFQAARNNMVDSQLRPNKVTDRRILSAMRRLPREAFVPQAHRALAYADAEVPLGDGRFLLEPTTVARLIQAAAVPEGGKVLVLGHGYAAAVFAWCGAHVTAVDHPGPAGERLTSVLPGCGGTVALVHGDLAAGWPAGAPYGCIFIDGAVTSLPALGTQLRAHPPGRLCAVVVADGRNGMAVIAEPAGATLATRPLFDCAATAMPEFNRPAWFRF